MNRTVAVARYALADLLRSQRFLPPLVVYFGFLAVFHSFQGPVLPGYGASAGALLPVAVWLTIVLHNTEDPVQAMVTVVNAGGHGRALLGRVCTCAAVALALTAAALLWPALAAAQVPPPADLTAGICAHVTCGVTGIALGTCCARPLIRRQGYAFAAGAVLSLLALVGRRLTPVNETVRLLSAAPPRPSAVVLLLLAVWAAGMLAVAAGLALYAGRRRG